MGGLNKLFKSSKADKLAQSLQRRYFVLEDGSVSD